MKRVDQIGGGVHHAAKGEYPPRIKAKLFAEFGSLCRLQRERVPVWETSVYRHVGCGAIRLTEREG